MNASTFTNSFSNLQRSATNSAWDSISHTRAKDIIPKQQRNPLRGEKIAPTFALVALFIVCGLSGCGNKSNAWSLRKEKKESDPVKLALESETADERREGIESLADSRNAKTDWAIEIYDTVARQDRDAMVRCAAVSALANHAETQGLTFALDVFSPDSQTATKMVTPPASVRCASARLVYSLARANTIPADRQERVVQVIVERIPKEVDHQTRLILIDSLGHFQRRNVPNTLIDLLDEDDFAVRRSAEGALVTLTGVSHQYDSKAWRTWLSSTQDPFANAGQTPAGWEKEDSGSRLFWFD